MIRRLLFITTLLLLTASVVLWLGTMILPFGSWISCPNGDLQFEVWHGQSGVTWQNYSDSTWFARWFWIEGESTQAKVSRWPGIRFERSKDDLGGSNYIPKTYDLRLQLYWPVLILAFSAAYQYHRLRRITANATRCPTCHYDLRATPTQCPECGHILSRKPTPNADPLSSGSSQGGDP